MRRLLVGFFTAIGFLSFLFVIAVVVLIIAAQMRGARAHK